MKKIIMATNNKGKIEELSKMLRGFEVISQKAAGIDIDPEENGKSFIENAIIKAEAIRGIFPFLPDIIPLSYLLVPYLNFLF